MKTTIFENLKPIEKTIYHKLKEPLLFYDISELGWSRYISAHINYLTKNKKKVSICCSKDREVLYRDITNEILPIPQSFYDKFDGMLSASHHLHDPIKNIDIIDTEIISKSFKEEYPDYNVISDYSKFYGERIFEPYKHSKESEIFCQKFSNCILIFPRFRTSRFSRRNISKEIWVEIIEKLCIEFKDLDIISIGGKDGTLDIDLPLDNYHNLVNVDNNLDILVALCNMKKVVTSFGTQSGIMHIATMCKSPSFIIGHDPYDMGIYTENFTKADIMFWQTIETEKGYKIDNIEQLILKLISFIDFIKNYKK